MTEKFVTSETGDSLLAALIDALEQLAVVEFCRCARPRSEHEYWEDRIYDYSGYKCPGVLGGEYHFDAVLTAARRRESKIKLAKDRLTALRTGSASPEPKEIAMIHNSVTMIMAYARDACERLNALKYPDAEKQAARMDTRT